MCFRLAHPEGITISVGWDGGASCTSGKTAQWGGNVNTPFADTTSGVAGLVMSSATLPATTADRFGTVAVAGLPKAGTKLEVIAQADTEDALFAAFAAGKTQPPTAAPTPPSAAGTSWCGAVVQTVTVPAGGSVTVDFVLAWHFPNRSLAQSVQQYARASTVRQWA